MTLAFSQIKSNQINKTKHFHYKNIAYREMSGILINEFYGLIDYLLKN